MFWSYVAFFRLCSPNSPTPTSYKLIGSRRRESWASRSSLKANQRARCKTGGTLASPPNPAPRPPISRARRGAHRPPGRRRRCDATSSSSLPLSPLYSESENPLVARRRKKSRLRGSCLLLRHFPCILQRGRRVPVTSPTPTPIIPVSGPL